MWEYRIAIDATVINHATQRTNQMLITILHDVVYAWPTFFFHFSINT